MKKVLMCGSALTEPGGMTSVCKQLVNHNWGDEYAIEYVATHVTGSPISKMHAFLSGLLRIRRELSCGNCSVVHIHMSYKGSFTRKYYVFCLCRRYEIPCLVHMHGSEFKTFFETSSASTKGKITEMLEGAYAVIALGAAWKQFFMSIAPQANVVVLKNAVAFHGAVPRDRHEVFGVVFLGLLIRRKGVADLIDGFASFVRDSTRSAHLYIAGTGEEEASLRGQVVRYGLEECVTFLGWIDVEERKEILSRCDVFVLPSYNEGLPIALLESMAVGLPPVVSNVGSVSEAVADGSDGLLISPGHPEQITEALTRLNEDKVLWQDISDAAMHKVEIEFDESLYFEKMKDMYRLACSVGAAD